MLNEHRISDGRLQMNHLQRAMGSQTFRAQVAVGSWSGTLLMPDPKVPTETKVFRIGNKGKEKEEENATPVINPQSKGQEASIPQK
jgi:hypothetical protein